jgi:hypothetical protein
VFWNGVLLCSSGWSQTPDPSTSVSWVLGLEGCATMPSDNTFSGSTRVWTQGLLGKCSTTWVMHPALFALVLFFLFFLIFGGSGAWTQGFTLAKQVLYCLSHTLHFAVYYGNGGLSQTICQVWPGTSIFPISGSQIARIAGVSHQTQPEVISSFHTWGEGVLLISTD